MKFPAAIFFFVLVNIQLEAQSFSKMMEVTNDEVTGTVVTRMKEYLYLYNDDKPVMALFIAQKKDDYGTETSLTMDCRDLGCILNGSPINFLFTDGSRAEFINISATNCVGFAMLYIGIPDYNGETIEDILRKKKIKTVRVNGTDKFVQANLTASDQVQLQNILSFID